MHASVKSCSAPFLSISQFSESFPGQNFWAGEWIHTNKVKVKSCFLLLHGNSDAYGDWSPLLPSSHPGSLSLHVGNLAQNSPNKIQNKVQSRLIFTGKPVPENSCKARINFSTSAKLHQPTSHRLQLASQTYDLSYIMQTHTITSLISPPER